MKKEIAFLFLLLSVIILMTGCSPQSLAQKWLTQPPEYEEQFIVPEVVIVELYRNLSDEMPSPVLGLHLGSEGGCSHAFNIRVAKTQSPTSLNINILGYNFSAYKGGGICTADIRPIEAEMSLDVEWLKSGAKDLVISLSGKENTYKLAYGNYALKLLPINVINVISRDDVSRSWWNDTPMSLKLLLPPHDVAYLRVPYTLPGYKSTNKDYRDQLREFAENNGLIPAEQAYLGFPQDEYDRLYVVSENGIFIEIEGNFSDGARVLLYK